MGNCVRQGSVRVGTIEKKKQKDPAAVQKLVEQADKQENEDSNQDKKLNKRTTINATEEDDQAEVSSASPLKNKKTNNQDKQSIKQKKSINSSPDRSPTGLSRKTKTFTEDIIQNQNTNVPTHILIQIEEQRQKHESTLKQQINDLNLEKNVVNCVIQLIHDYLLHIKDTKKYWVSIKLIGFSKAEQNQNQVGGSLSFVVEYNTGEMIKLRIVFSKDIDKSNYDLDTFVFYSKLENPNLSTIQDFNFRISPNECMYHETSVSQMITNQAKTEKPQMAGSSFRQMFTDLLNLLNYFSEVKYIHGGIHPSNIYVKKYMQKDGKYIQKALLDISLSNNLFNRRNTKFKEFAFRKSSDLQMFAISMLSLMSSMNINQIQETNKKSIITSKISAPSIIQVDNDIRYALNCILKGSDMILEFGASEIKNHFDNSINYDNHLALNRPNQQQISVQFCYFINNGNEIIVYSFYTKWVFGYRIYDDIRMDSKVNIKLSYCHGDYLYIIFEIHDSLDLYITKINLRKKCLDTKSLNIIKSISDTLCKLQRVKNEEDLDIVKAYETINSKNEEYISTDDFLQFAYDNKIKDIQNSQTQDYSTIISCFDELDTGKLNFYEFKNMIQYIMCTRPFITYEVAELIELPRHYMPASIIKKGNDLYLLGGSYQSLPSNKCFRYFIKNLKENQEVQNLEYLSSSVITLYFKPF